MTKRKRNAKRQTKNHKTQLDKAAWTPLKTEGQPEE